VPPHPGNGVEAGAESARNRSRGRNDRSSAVCDREHSGLLVMFMPGCKRGNDYAGVSRFHRRVCSRFSRTSWAVSLGSSISGMATTPVPRFCNVIGVAATSISSRSSPARISRDCPRFKLSAWRSDLGTISEFASPPTDRGAVAGGAGADAGAWLGPADKIREAVADASSAAAKNLRRRAPSAKAGGWAGLACSVAWAAADRPRAQS
jgi:hypothetical protein